jgi:TrmH family RNA methyltransferase
MTKDGLTPVLAALVDTSIMMKRIESRDNPTFRKIAALRRTQRSRASGLVFLEGSRLCADALHTGAKAEYALLADSAAATPACCEILADLPESVTLLCLPDRLFNSICGTDQPQGIALVCQSPSLAMPAGLPAADGLYLVAEGIQDPGNLGTMIRTADAFAFNAVIITSGTVFPFSDKVLRAAMGSCFHIPLLAMPDIGTIARWLAADDSPAVIMAADPCGPDGFPSDLPLPAALVVGNEAHGLSPEARQLCSCRVGIPMPGRAESLNAATAAAILCYELMRLRLNIQRNVL